MRFSINGSPKFSIGTRLHMSWCEDPTAPPTAGMYGGKLAAPLLGLASPTGDAEADALLAQGLAQEWNFNTHEARRNLQMVVQLHPKCALCWWALARTFASNINRGASPRQLAAAAKNASAALSTTDSDKVRSLVESIQVLAAAPTTHSGSDEETDADTDAIRRRAYADAICARAENTLADDADLGALCADAEMATTPWNYFTHTRLSEGPGKLKPELARASQLLARFASPAASPPHLLAQHLALHLAEPRTGPFERTIAAEPIADAVLERGPAAAGHLMHMPSHLYLRTGKYHAGVLSSQRALVADEAYLAKCLCPYAHAHDAEMGLWHALMGGESAAAHAFADKLGSLAGSYDGMPDASGCTGERQYPRKPCWPSLVHVRFGMFGKVLARGRPAACAKRESGGGGSSDGGSDGGASGDGGSGGSWSADHGVGDQQHSGRPSSQATGASEAESECAGMNGEHHTMRLFAYGMALAGTIPHHTHLILIWPLTPV